MRVAAAAIIAVFVASLSAQQPRPAARAPRAEPRREAAVPFKPGETLTFDVSWSQFLTAGTAVSKVVEKKPSFNSTAYYIVADGRPLPILARFYSLYYKMDSLLDSVTTLSHHSSLYIEEGSQRRVASTRFDRARRRAHYEIQGEASTKTDFAIPANVQDGLATLYALRTRTFKAGDRFTVPIADDGAVYTADFETLPPERVRVQLGDIDAWNLRVSLFNAERQPVGSNLAAWISTDARRLPVKLQAELPVGRFVLALRDVQ